MTKIKICGLSRKCDIEAANALLPDYIGFVFFRKSKRYVSFEQAKELKAVLNTAIKAVGVFVDESIENIVTLLDHCVIDIVQLHGNEDEDYIKELRSFTDKPIIKAFCINNEDDIVKANNSTADYILLDSGKGSGNVFDWGLITKIKRPYFLAGGLSADIAEKAIEILNPFALDVSSGVEKNGLKDKNKMAAFVDAIRKDEKYDE
ncbi:MAG: phosphoribosylanthranilate isomerase [Eubacterium sp.]|nr:phosphoribosylanthranilate isomerase [Eubacterium sp.]